MYLSSFWLPLQTHCTNALIQEDVQNGDIHFLMEWIDVSPQFQIYDGIWDRKLRNMYKFSLITSIKHQYNNTYYIDKKENCYSMFHECIKDKQYSPPPRETTMTVQRNKGEIYRIILVCIHFLSNKIF